MTTSIIKTAIASGGEEDSPLHFSEWVKHRRQELDLTQELLAKRTSCSVFSIRKIEMGERRPSRQLAGLLAQALKIPPADQAAFLKVARGELGVERVAALYRLYFGKSFLTMNCLDRCTRPSLPRVEALGSDGGKHRIRICALILH